MPDLPEMKRLLEIMAALRTPVTGCPWDLEQDFTTIAPYTIEEAYEVSDAIQRDDMDDLKDELGDLLLQVVFHAQMAEEAGLFAFEDVAASINTKMVRRHPHVFGSTTAEDPVAVKVNWDAIKAEEKAERLERRKASGMPPEDDSLLNEVPIALPALTRAIKLQKRAARVGFDWPDIVSVVAKINEELGELVAEIDADADASRLEDEVGDVIFAVANLARRLNVEAETALRSSNEKFVRRFRRIEQVLADRNVPIEDASLDDMEAIWISAKTDERGDGQAT